MSFFGRIERQILGGLQSRGISVTKTLPHYVSKADREIVTQVTQFTMQPPIRLYALLRAVEYVVEEGIFGSLVECGVWKGGAAMAMALKLSDMGVVDREIFLVDTFEGMTNPTGIDRQSRTGKSAADLLAQDPWKVGGVWARAPLGIVKTNMQSTKYPSELVRYVAGDVSATLPKVEIGEIAILRVDVDWYQPTLACLQHLYPKLRSRGVIISDDYGHWDGARQAFDEYFKRPDTPQPFFSSVDNDCVFGQKS